MSLECFKIQIVLMKPLKNKQIVWYKPYLNEKWYLTMLFITTEYWKSVHPDCIYEVGGSFFNYNLECVDFGRFQSKIRLISKLDNLFYNIYE